MQEQVAATIGAVADAFRVLRNDHEAHQRIARGADLLIRTFSSGGQVYTCGNGGSMCEAMHLAQELAGTYRAERAPLPAVAVSDPAYLTCVSNDFGFDRVFERFVSANVRPCDLLVVMSTSGQSANVVAAARSARKVGASVLAITGRPDSPLAAVSDVVIWISGPGTSDRIQEYHLVVVHLLVELVEREYFPETYSSSPADQAIGS